MADDVLMTPNIEKEHNLNYNDSVSRSASGPFRATQLWAEIVENLKQQVEVKKRKILMRSYDHCFTGTDAVDVILNQLLSDKDNFPNKDITREKAARLCQHMLDQSIFEPVKGKGSEDKSTEFEDSSTKLYRFLVDKENESYPSKCQSCSELSKPDDAISTKSHGIRRSKSRRSSSASLLQKHQGVMQELLELTGSWDRSSNSSSLKRKLTPARLFNVGPGRMSFPAVGSADMSASSITSQEQGEELDGLEKLTPEVEEELMREVALSQLLTLVDIPILDNILSYCIERAKSGSTKHTAYSNLAFRRCESVMSLFSNSGSDKDDLWWESALDCIECLPKGLDMLDISLTEKSDLTQKLRLYQSIADHYAGVEEPLWSDSFVDIHLGLFNLLMQARRDLVLKGICLAIVMLPGEIKEEMKRLLSFLKQCVTDDSISLSSTVDNRVLVQRVFTGVVIKNKMLAPHQAGQLVMFMVDHADKLWEAPEEVEESVRLRLTELQEGRERSHVVKTYCTQVSSAEFRKQQEECTEQALVAMMNCILDDIKMTLKDKKYRLKQLQKHHPKIYWKHFADML